MEELKPCPQEAEALDIIESLLDVADMKCTGPLYADAPPRSGMCRIPEDDAIKLRQYIADRRAAPENKPLTLEQLRQIDEITDVEIKPLKPRLWHRFQDCISTGCFETFNYEDYGKTWLAYVHKPEGSAP